MEANNDSTLTTQNLDFKTLLKGAEVYRQQKASKTEQSEDLPKINFQALLKGSEIYKQQKATQQQVSTVAPISETPQAETQTVAVAAPLAKKSLLGKLVKYFGNKKSVEQPNVPADPGRRKLLQLGLATAGLAIAGGLAPTPKEGDILNIIGKLYLESDFTKDILIPTLAKEAEKRRPKNPESEGIDPELAKEVDFSILIAGSGSELTDYGERNADATQLLTFSKKHGIKMIAIHRDIQSPEVYETAKKLAQQKGEKAPETYESEIMRAIRVGGPELLKKVAQHVTGAPVDFYVEIEHDAVPDIINDLFGDKGISVNVPEDIPPDIYGRRGFSKGQQMMNGEDIDVYVKTRTSSTMERRNSAQQEVLKLVMQEFFRRLKTNSAQDNKDMLIKTKDTIDKLQKEGKLIIDIPIENTLLAIASQWQRMATNTISQRASFFNLPNIPPGMVFAEGEDLKRAENRGPRDALMNPIDKTTGAIISPDLSHDNTIQELVNYYRSLRKNSRKFITGV